MAASVFSPIQPINGIAPLGGVNSAAAASGGPASNSFVNMIAKAVSDLDATQQSADHAVNQFVQGGTVDLHTVTIQMQQAALEFRLGLQVQSKALGAYEEIMRMTV